MSLLTLFISSSQEIMQFVRFLVIVHKFPLFYTDIFSCSDVSPSFTGITTTRDKLWLGIIQLDINAVGRFRHYKWERSNVDIPSAGEYWANRYVPAENHPISCGYFKMPGNDARLFDGSCAGRIGLICEW